MPLQLGMNCVLQFSVSAAADYWVKNVIAELTLEPQLVNGGAVFFDEVDQ
jgi:hypothetical protein